MIQTAILLSIAPTYAERILSGAKSVELRRIRPRISKGDLMLVYVSAPKKELRAVAIVEGVLAKEPGQLWTAIKQRTGMTTTEFSEYFAGASIGYAIMFHSVHELESPVSLSNLRFLWPGFHPPRSHRYFSQKDVEKLCLPASIMPAIDKNNDNQCNSV